LFITHIVIKTGTQAKKKERPQIGFEQMALNCQRYNAYRNQQIVACNQCDLRSRRKAGLVNSNRQK
jgi:hypothetical protein